MTDEEKGSAPRGRAWGAVLLALGLWLGVGIVMHPGGAPAQTAKLPLLVARPAAPAAAISLTGSDGSGLELVSLQAHAVIEDPLAFTELRLVFRNPESRVREGRFRITLPSGATVSRFAMRIGDRLQEGEVVEQQAARVAYEDFLHRRQDPALLETEAGNEFSARVFPIPANATKELIVSYSQELTRRDEDYTLPLRGLPKLGTLSIRALVKKESAGGKGPASSLGGRRAQTEVVQVDKRDFVPDVDFRVAHTGSNSRLGVRHDNLVAARIVPLSDSAERDAVSSLFVMIDTSASRALGLAEQVSATEQLLASLPPDAQVTLAAFDQTVTPIYSGRAGAIGDGVRKAVLARRALGASDLDAALRWLASALAKQQHKRVLLVSDGVATAGEISADKLRARVKALSTAGVERLDVLAVGGIRDDVTLSRLVTAGLARDGIVLDATRPIEVLSQKLTRATRSGLKLEVDGAGWVWPGVLNGVQPGDEFIVYADLPADKPFGVKLDGKPLALAGALAQVERPLLERAWVKARIDRLGEQRDAVASSDRDLAAALKQQVIELSTKHRVLSPYTSLLVLETEQDYARFGIERRALADILTVDANGIALVHRAEIAAPLNQVATRPRDDRPAADKPAIAAPPPPSASDLAGASPQKSAADSRERRREAEAPMQSAPIETNALGYAGPGSAGQGQSVGGAASGFGRGAVAAEAQPSRAPTAPAPEARSEARDEQPSARVAARRRPVQEAPAEPREEAKKREDIAPVEGELKQVLDLLRAGKKQPALAQALAWRERDAGDVLALVALGEAWEALSDPASAARAYGSIIDLFPGRADMRRFAGERLERVRTSAALALAADTYAKAVAQRPDHPASHRLLGFALLKQARPRAAFEAILAGVKQSYPDGRFRGVERILREDLGLMAAAWIKQEPALADQIRSRVRAAGAEIEDEPSIRFVLNWETDANDVDFHIHDGKGGHAYYSSPHLPAGGDLYADVTTGYGPECFTIRGASTERAYPYKLQAHYYSKGPMGYGMGKLQVIDHDGHGGFRFEERPFVVMQDGAFVSLGTVQGPAVLVAK
jgi:tetratricopeptide (TPR) repeat protein